MFSKPKRTTPEELAGELAATILDPDARSAAAARIPGRPDPDPVGSREVAFAGIAALKHVISETRAGPIADRMNAAVDVALAQAFAGPYKPRILARFGPGGLATAGAEAVAGYMAPAYWSRKLAEAVAARLRVRGESSAALAPLAQVFEEISTRSALAISRSSLV